MSGVGAIATMGAFRCPPLEGPVRNRGAEGRHAPAPGDHPVASALAWHPQVADQGVAVCCRMYAAWP